MIKNSTLILLLIILSRAVQSQTPVVLRPDISISQVMNVQGGVVRLAYNPIDSSFYYGTMYGDIYKVNIDAAGQGTDTLIYSVIDHGIPRIQGMAFHDSCLYVSGNLQQDSVVTIGIIMRGKIVAGNFREWETVAQTVPYETAGIFDHLFSGMTLNLAGDTILMCSGSRGDHGEIESRSGLYPGLRNVPVTSVILQIPASGTNIIIPNDSAALDAGGFVFARGIRNTFDFAYNSTGDLFGAENSCDRDMEDELNWLRPGKNYGFPWMIGGSYNPQQFSWFDPSADSLINHNSSAWIYSGYYNDTLFPQIPAGLQLTMPCKNFGPDAAFMRDSATGVTYDAAAIGESIYSFTPHRSPLGLTFDRDSILGNDFRGNGFVLSWTRGDSSLANASPLLAPFNDHAEDLLMLKMEKDSVNDNYSFHAYKIAEGFSSPVDAVLMDTCMYIIEVGFSGTESLWRIDFPRYINVSNSISENNSTDNVIAYPNPANGNLNFSFKNGLDKKYDLQVYDEYSRKVFSKIEIKSDERFTLNTSAFDQGIYFWNLSGEQLKSTGHFVVLH